MRITIQLQPDAARALHAYLQDPSTHKSSPDAQQLLNIVNRHKGKIEPVHPGQTHPLLLGNFTVEIPASGAGKRIMEELTQLGSISAYLSPEPETP